MVTRNRPRKIILDSAEVEVTLPNSEYDYMEYVCKATGRNSDVLFSFLLRSFNTEGVLSFDQWIATSADEAGEAEDVTNTPFAVVSTPVSLPASPEQVAAVSADAEQNGNRATATAAIVAEPPQKPSTRRKSSGVETQTPTPSNSDGIGQASLFPLSETPDPVPTPAATTTRKLREPGTTPTRRRTRTAAAAGSKKSASTKVSAAAAAARGKTDGEKKRGRRPGSGKSGSTIGREMAEKAKGKKQTSTTKARTKSPKEGTSPDTTIDEAT